MEPDVRRHAAEIDANGWVLRVIVGSAGWAAENLGGEWVECGKAGPGWRLVDGLLTPPEVPEVEAGGDPE